MRVAVIGSGVVGASAAWHLARAGAETILIDAAVDGRATAAGAGIIDPWAGAGAPAPDAHRLALAAGRNYPVMLQALAEAGETDTGYARCGSLVVDEDPARLDALARELLARRATEPEMGDIERLDPIQARAAFPPLHPALGGVRIGGGARVDGRRLAGALGRAAARAGARAVAGPASLLDRGIGVRVGTDDVAADAVLVAAGAWTAGLLAPLGIALGVAPQRGQIVHLRVPGTTDLWPSILPAADHYVVSFEDGRVVAGATRETGSGFDHRLTAAGQMRVLADALRIAPGLGDAGVIEWRVGFRPLTADRLPLLGPLPARPGLFVATGAGATGLTTGPFAGSLLADLILGRAPALDLVAYAPLR